MHTHMYLISFSVCNERFIKAPPLPSVAMVTSEFVSQSASSSPSELFSAFRSWEAEREREREREREKERERERERERVDKT